MRDGPNPSVSANASQAVVSPDAGQAAAAGLGAAGDASVGADTHGDDEGKGEDDDIGLDAIHAAIPCQ